MNKELLEKGVEAHDTPEENNYQRYLELGGIINEKDYNNALTRSKNSTIPEKTLITNAENIAKFSGIELHNTKDAIDPRIILYGILRRDVQPKEVKHHHQQMSDQQIFVEALRMLGDIKSLDKIIKAYPNISFKYS